MKTRYLDLIEQTFDWPQEEFHLDSDELHFHGIDLMDLIHKFGTPLRFTYLPRIGNRIHLATGWFKDAMKKLDYPGEYHYCYVTKSSHFRHVTEEVLRHGAHLETSSAYDLDIVRTLEADGHMSREATVICNGFKTEAYIDRIAGMHAAGFSGILPVLDNELEFDMLESALEGRIDVGLRIASEEEPKFEFYTSRLGMGYKHIRRFHEERLAGHPKFNLRMLHFFVNTGIRDTAYYWNELRKALDVYCALKEKSPDLTALNIGGGLPIKNSLGFEYDYPYMIEAILEQIQLHCTENGVAVPDIFTEFGSFTVGEAGGTLYKVLYQKRQNDRERWNLIDSSFMTTLPDTWAINKRFMMLPVNRWMDDYERVFLGGLTCDSDDYYNSEQHLNAIYLPKFNADQPLYLAFFNTAAYQDNIGGHGGVHHCLIPGPRHVLIDRDAEGALRAELFCEEQGPEEVLGLLGYGRQPSLHVELGVLGEAGKMDIPAGRRFRTESRNRQ